MSAVSAPQSRAAVSTTVSSTGCTSAVERLMTLSTSLVAVWYSSNSSRSRVRACNSPSSRAFSIAMTAWSAKVRTSSICRSVNGSTRFRLRLNRADHGALAQQRHPKDGASPGRHNLGQRVVRVSEDVRDMHDPAFERHPPGDAVATGDDGSLAQRSPNTRVRRIRMVDRHVAVDLALAYCDRSGIGAAKPDGRFDYCVQHRLHIGGRAADDLEHVAGRGLVFERFFKIARAGLQFAEQPRILHRDDRLVGKGAHQFDLPLGERLDPLPREINRAEHGPLAQQRHPKWVRRPAATASGIA